MPEGSSRASDRWRVVLFRKQADVVAHAEQALENASGFTGAAHAARTQRHFLLSVLLLAHARTPADLCRWWLLGAPELINADRVGLCRDVSTGVSLTAIQ